MENVNFNFTTEQEAYEAWNEYNEQREAEDFTNAQVEALKKMVFKNNVWRTGQAIS